MTAAKHKGRDDDVQGLQHLWQAPGRGRNVSHSHRVTNRMFHPNVQKLSAVVDGRVKKINVCTKCIKAGKVTRA